MQTQESSRTPQKVLVVGATGGTGVAAVRQLQKLGHHVTAFSRHASDKFSTREKLTPIDGDVMNPVDIEQAVKGQNAVIVVLGISENPLLVRFFGPKNTPVKVRSEGTQNVVNAMRKHGVKRLVVQTSYGIGESRECLNWVNKLFFRLVLKPQIEDTETQEQQVRASDLDWVLVQPVHLTNDINAPAPCISTREQTRNMKVSRESVAAFLANAINRFDYLGKTVAISG